MRILTINLHGSIPSGIDSNLISANVFQDYDAVIVDPESLDHLYHGIDYINPEQGIIATSSGQSLLNINSKRKEQVNGLLKRGGVVVCFMRPLIKYACDLGYGGEEYWHYITNYDWLLEMQNATNELVGLKFGTGTTIDFIDSGHPFFEYLNTKPAWSAYIDKDTYKNWKVLASAYGTHAVALGKREGLGHIVLIPSYYDYSNGELLERCIVKLLGDKETSPQPSWTKSILVPGQKELNSKITEFSDKIDSLTEKRKELFDKRDNLENWKKLLYSKGKHELEPVVREALTIIGCQVEPQPDKDSDGLVSCDYGTALLEVTGSKGTIKIEKFGELKKNMGNFITEKGGKIKGVLKGILVGNPFCEMPLDNRPPENSQKDLFATQLIASAEKQDISVLLSTDLYHVVESILKSEFAEEEKLSLQERIFTGRGLVRLV